MEPFPLCQWFQQINMQNQLHYVEAKQVYNAVNKPHSASAVKLMLFATYYCYLLLTYRLLAGSPGPVLNITQACKSLSYLLCCKFYFSLIG